jgi:low affinity Fe/Cu permease
MATDNVIPLHRADPAARALLAVGTARYESPDFPDLDEVPASLEKVTGTLTRLGYNSIVTGSPGYSVNPGLRELRTLVRRAAAAAPIVVVYYMGHGAQPERDTYYLVTKESDPADLAGTALSVSDLLRLLTARDEKGEIAADQPAVLVMLDCAYAGLAGMEMLGNVARGIGNPNTWVISSTGELEYAQQGLFAEAFCKAVENPLAGKAQRFLSLDYIVQAVNDAQTGHSQQARIFSAANFSGVPPFFPNVFFQASPSDSLRSPEDSASLGSPEHAPQAVDAPIPDDDALVVEPVRLIVPAITDDAVEGHQDRLGVDADARAMAALVASRRLEPPLAIGLYGEWGSGKTFFMKRVQAHIEDLGTNGATEVFCSAVAPVWFSAWQYAEGNLWASLLHHIFASLYPNKPQPQLALEAVMAKVQSAQQVTSAVEDQVKSATTRLDGATEAIAAAEERHRKALEDSKVLRAKDLWEAVTLTADDQDLKEQVVSAADNLGLTVATESAQDMMRATRQVVGLASRTRVLATSGPWFRSPLAFAFYAAIIIGSLGLLIGAVVHAAHQWAGTAITAIGQLAAVGSAAAAWIIRQGNLARRFIAPAEALQQRLEDRLAKQQAENERELVTLEQDAETAKAELAVALQQRAAAEQQLAAAKEEKTELTGKRLLRRYLAERASSGDYEHYMGVVALAHRDLVDLEEYLRAAMDDKDGKEGLDRIVLYIDDLDRCDPDVVAEVLDAVYLLLALPLFAVIVGVDPRWLKRSLHQRHPELLEPTPSSVPSTSATDYLEKIFQLTYSLPHMSSDRCADLLVAAAQETQSSSISQDQRKNYTASIDPISQDTEPGIEESSLDDDIEIDAATPSEDSIELVHISAENLAEALTLRKEDIEALREISPLISISPRRAKRFLSIYLVIRARALGDPVLRKYMSSNGDPPESMPDNSLLMLVALLLGSPKTMAASIRDSQLSDTSHNIAIGTWLTESVSTAMAPEEQERLNAFLNSESSLATLPVDTVMRWLSVARPYLPLGLEDLQDPVGAKVPAVAPMDPRSAEASAIREDADAVVGVSARLQAERANDEAPAQPPDP